MRISTKINIQVGLLFILQGTPPAYSLIYKITPHNLITKICIQSFHSKVEGLSKMPPPGMDKYTCKCFLEKLNKGFSIEISKETCKEKAIKEFNL